MVRIPGEEGTGAFSVATINVGAAETISVSADTGNASLPVTVFVCETDPVTALCQDDPAPTVTANLSSGQTSTFSFFVVGAGTVPFDPAGNRIFARFENATGQSRGATSVAVLTEG